MAFYKYGTHFKTADHKAFDTKLTPGTQAPHAGIYRCVGCGDEIGIAKLHTLPPQNHHQHSTTQGAVLWQLLVAAEQR